MRIRHMSHRAAVVTLIGVVVVSVASVAFAAWTVTGSGSGSVKAATVTALNASAEPTSPLFPGSTADITVTVTNKNPFPVEVQSFTAGKGVTVDRAHADGCDGSNVVVLNKSGLRHRIDAGDTRAFTVEASVSMSNDAPAACQGASFEISLALAGISLPD
jgi:hypothetical protein